MKQHTLAFLDLEATALDPFQGEIIEIGIVLVKQEKDLEGLPVLTKLSEHLIALIPEHIETADPKSLEVCKYHERDWSHAVTQRDGIAEALRVLKDTIIVAQNVGFDWAYLQKAVHDQGMIIEGEVHYHKLDLASMAFGKLYTDATLFKYSLRELAGYFGVENSDAHTALSDARTTFLIAAKLLRR
jgi:DNA polymerase III epsilon subunit-like protein